MTSKVKKNAQAKQYETKTISKNTTEFILC